MMIHLLVSLPRKSIFVPSKELSKPDLSLAKIEPKIIPTTVMEVTAGKYRIALNNLYKGGFLLIKIAKSKGTIIKQGTATISNNKVLPKAGQNSVYIADPLLKRFT